jgi:hypothetical protein
VIEVNYIGNHSTRQVAPELSNINQVDPRYLPLGQLLTRNINSPEARAAGIAIPWSGFNGSVAQALRAFPQYLTLTSQQAKIGASSYHGAEFKLRKRFATGLSFEASYTRSKAIGLNAPGYQGFGGLDNMLQDHFNLRERVVAAFRTTCRMRSWLTTSHIALRQGRRLAQELAGRLDSLGIHRYQSGYPLQLSMNDLLPVFNRVLRPDLLAGVDPSSGLGNGDFDPGRNDRITNARAFASPVARRCLPVWHAGADTRRSAAVPGVAGGFRVDQAFLRRARALGFRDPDADVQCIRPASLRELRAKLFEPKLWGGARNQLAALHSARREDDVLIWSHLVERSINDRVREQARRAPQGASRAFSFRGTAGPIAGRNWRDD